MKAILLAGLVIIATPAFAADTGVIWDSATIIHRAPPAAPYHDPSDIIQGRRIVPDSRLMPDDSNTLIHGSAPLPPNAPRPDRPLGIG
jgi:hypothetical protein